VILRKKGLESNEAAKDGTVNRKYGFKKTLIVEKVEVKEERPERPKLRMAMRRGHKKGVEPGGSRWRETRENVRESRGEGTLENDSIS